MWIYAPGKCPSGEWWYGTEEGGLKGLEGGSEALAPGTLIRECTSIGWVRKQVWKSQPDEMCS